MKTCTLMIILYQPLLPQDKFEKVCLPIARLYNKLEACMYEADYLVFHSGLPLTAVPHESITFYVSLFP